MPGQTEEGQTQSTTEPTAAAVARDASPKVPATTQDAASPEAPPPVAASEPKAPAKKSRSVRVTIKGFRNTKGQALVSLFANSKGFPDKGKIAQERKAYRIVGDEIKIRFNDVDPGTYAVAVLHDEDKNFKMKTGLMGIPKEGYGVSNNAKGRFGPPKFADAKFKVTAKSDAQVTISMIYH